MIDQDRPLVSIIMPCFNGEHHLAQSIDSVLSQKVSDWELIVIDDCSSDSSVSLVERYRSDPRLKQRLTLLKNESQQGPAVSRNRGIEAARGRYIAFLDCDDVWLENRLISQIDLFQDRQVRLVCGGYRVIDATGAPTGAAVMPPKRTDYHQMLVMNTVGCLTAMYDTERSGKVHMPLIPRRQDYGLWLSLIRDGGEVAGAQEIVALYRSHPGSISSNKLAVAYWQWYLYRKHEKLPHWKSAWCVFNHFWAKRAKYQGSQQ